MRSRAEPEICDIPKENKTLKDIIKIPPEKIGNNSRTCGKFP